MRRSRGLKLGKVFKWIVRRRRKTGKYLGLGHRVRLRNPISKLLTLLRSLKRGAKELCSPRSEYIRLGQDPFKNEVPKGHLAVYVGDPDNQTRRVLVPVIYFNHPLFSELLKEAERVHGYNYPGGITIPCRISEFEKVQTRIQSGDQWWKCSWRRYW